MEQIGKVTFIRTHSIEHGLQTVLTSNPDVIAKLTGPMGKKQTNRRREYQQGDEVGKPTGPKMADMVNTVWFDEDGKRHGNGKKYVRVNKGVHQLLAEPDEVEE